MFLLILLCKCVIINSKFVRKKMFWNYMMPTGFLHPAMFPSIFSNYTAIKQCPTELRIGQNEVDDGVKDENLFINLNRKDLLDAGYESHKKPWTQEEDETLRRLRDKQCLQWIQIAEIMPERNSKMCYSRYRRLENHSKQIWKKSQNQRMVRLVEEHGEDWKVISQSFKKRTEKQVKEHYLNYLRPDIKKQEWDLNEDLKLIDYLNKHGKDWKLIEQNFDGRTQNQIKNRYFGRLKRLAEKKMLAKVKQSTEYKVQ